MPDIAHTATDMIAGMTPVLIPGTYVFASLPDDQAAAPLLPRAIALFREAEGISLILPRDVARAAGLSTQDPMRCITLNVYSSLTGVGLTAAVASALGAAGIACNMVAACHHDHAFVPAAAADTALDILKALQAAPPQP